MLFSCNSTSFDLLIKDYRSFIKTSENFEDFKDFVNVLAIFCLKLASRVTIWLQKRFLYTLYEVF